MFWHKFMCFNWAAYVAIFGNIKKRYIVFASVKCIEILFALGLTNPTVYDCWLSPMGWATLNHLNFPLGKHFWIRECIQTIFNAHTCVAYMQ